MKCCGVCLVCELCQPYLTSWPESSPSSSLAFTKTLYMFHGACIVWGSLSLKSKFVILSFEFIIIGQSCVIIINIISHSSVNSLLCFPLILYSSWSPWLSNMLHNWSNNNRSHCRRGLYNPVKATWNERAST